MNARIDGMSVLCPCDVAGGRGAAKSDAGGDWAAPASGRAPQPRRGLGPTGDMRESRLLSSGGLVMCLDSLHTSTSSIATPPRLLQAPNLPRLGCRPHQSIPRRGNTSIPHRLSRPAHPIQPPWYTPDHSHLTCALPDALPAARHSAIVTDPASVRCRCTTFAGHLVHRPVFVIPRSAPTLEYSRYSPVVLPHAPPSFL